ncbi:MAG: tetratricopeptide repeat protein [Deltaproteobacteria bacterium]|nr:tetratricopeptide repeat protein [Deltaproteobacteria bacterium]
MKFSKKGRVCAYLAALIAVAYPSAGFAGPASKEGSPPKRPQMSAAASESFKLNEKGVAQIKAREFSAAEESFRKALQADKGNMTAAFNLASAYLINKKESAAIELLKEYTKKDPSDAGLWVRLGDAYFGTKDVGSAVKSYEQAYKIAPDYEELTAKLSTAYLLANNLHLAEEMLVKAVEKDPRDYKLLSNLSNLYLGSGKPEQAVTIAKRALQVKATKEVYVTLASAYEVMKDYKNSLIAYQRAVDLGEDRPEVFKKIEGLKEAVS